MVHQARFYAVLMCCLIGCSDPEVSLAPPPRDALPKPNEAQEKNPTMTDHRVIVLRELASLLERENDDAFVIFEERKSGKFVQFAGRKGESLLLDLPEQTLSNDEANRADDLFRDLGEQMQEYDLHDRPNGKPSERQRSFQLQFGNDIELAADITLRVFFKVYQFPNDFTLGVTRN